MLRINDKLTPQSTEQAHNWQEGSYPGGGGEGQVVGTSFSKHSRLGPHLTRQYPTKSVGYQLPISTESLKLMLDLKGDMRLCPGYAWAAWALSVKGSIGKFSQR